ncbi:hypothetical protein [Streptomyces sp. NPDC097619]|uniref:hypothetical protein n=1 Tax=Streptomyces sp. NPDC097619 TaxID=3157228 RepID=UPI003320C1D4
MKRVFGVAAILAGGVLALFFPDLEFGWFEGRPFGVVLVVLGVIELAESTRRRKPKGIVEELREDFGLSGSRGRDADRERDRDREMRREFDREVEREARKHRDHPGL